MAKEMKMNAEFKAERLGSLLNTIEEVTLELRGKIQHGNMTPNEVCLALSKIQKLTIIANEFQAERLDKETLDVIFINELNELLSLVR